MPHANPPAGRWCAKVRGEASNRRTAGLVDAAPSFVAMKMSCVVLHSIKLSICWYTVKWYHIRGGLGGDGGGGVQYSWELVTKQELHGALP